MKKILIPILLLCFYSCENEISENTSENTISNFNSKYENSDKEINLENAYFIYSSKEENKTNNDIVLKVNHNKTINKATKKSKSSFQISSIDNTWKIFLNADEIEVKDNVLLAKTDAKDGLEETFSIHNLESGKHLVDYTYDKLIVKIPETNFKRYIAYTSLANSKNILKSYDKNTIGLLTYSSEKNVLQKILIKSSTKIDSITPDMRLVSISEKSRIIGNVGVLYFTYLDENYKNKDIDFAFGLSYYVGADESSILFEVTDNKLIKDKVKYDKKIFDIEFL